LQPEISLNPTIYRVERFALESRERQTALLSFLNPECTHLHMFHTRSSMIDLGLGFTLLFNLCLFSSLTQLRIGRLNGLVAFGILCDHATELRQMKVTFWPKVSCFAFYPFYLTPI